MTAADDFAPGPFDITADVGAPDIVFGCNRDDGAVPEELRDIVELVRSARRPGSVDELIADDAMIASIAAAITREQVPVDARRVSKLSKLRSVKVTAAVTVMVMVGGTAAAAATGSLPSPIQSLLAKQRSGARVERRVRHHPDRTVRTTVRHDPTEAAPPPTLPVRVRSGTRAPNPTRARIGGTRPHVVTTRSDPRGRTFEYHPPRRSSPGVVYASRPNHKHGHSKAFAHNPRQPFFYGLSPMRHPFSVAAATRLSPRPRSWAEVPQHRRALPPGRRVRSGS